ncbi:MAG: IS200/IS605 family transposase [Kiritimatiellaeota bacterium]|nr:IS200/IS605 family transposase [Kiritimatiellota bacterium]
MANTYVCLNVHIVFSVKGRAAIILPDWRPRLWAYLGGIAREHDLVALEVGGTADHVHALVSLPTVMAVAKAVQLLKGNSSKWIHETIRPPMHFEWQEGYGAFSVGVSQIEATRVYIRNQEEHHRGRTFEEEYRAFLQKNGVTFDEKYVWG